MQRASDSHPTPAQLQAFDAGSLPAAETELVERHVEGCAACSGALDDLPEGPLAALLRAFGTRPLDGSEPKGETGLADLPAALAGHPCYRVLERLGAGGMGVVYKAVHRLKDRVVALKVINRSLSGRPAFVERFRREARAATRLAHPNTVATYDAEQVGDTHFLVMEFVAGTGLDRIVERRGPLPVPEACDLIRQAALGLQHAHERGVIHRDVKPANLLVTPTGRVKVLDFGLARMVDPESGAAPSLPSATVVGTPDYVAPEQARDPKQADARADVYSLGCTLYHLLAGRPPFPGGTVLQKLLAQQECVPEPLTTVRHDVPAELTAILERMLAKDPALRHATAGAVAEELARCAATGSAPTIPKRQYLSRRIVTVCGGALLAAALGAFAVWHTQRTGGTPAPASGEPPPDPSPEPNSEPVAPPALTSAAELARQKMEMRDRAVDWVRANNRWGPEHPVVADVARTIDPARKDFDAFEATLGDGLVKSGRRTILAGHAGAFHLFALTPEQARGSPTGDRGSRLLTYANCADARRAAPRVQFVDLDIDNADALSLGRPLTGTVRYTVPESRPDGCKLRLTYYSDRRRHQAIIDHVRLPDPERGTFTFSFPMLAKLGKIPAGPLVLFLELMTGDENARIVESNAAAAVVRLMPSPSGKP